MKRKYFCRKARTVINRKVIDREIKMNKKEAEEWDTYGFLDDKQMRKILKRGKC